MRRRDQWFKWLGLVQLDSLEYGMSNICSHVCGYFGGHGRGIHGRILLSLRTQTVEEFIPSKRLPLVLHHHPHSSEIMRGEVLDSTEDCAGNIAHSRDLDPLKTQRDLCKI